MSEAFAYFIFGPVGAGRAELVADLIDGGLDRGEAVTVYYAEAQEPPFEQTVFENFGDRVTCLPWRMDGDRIACETPSSEEMVFFVTDGTANPVDQVEAFRNWLSAQPHEVGGVITVVDCAQAQAHSELMQWYDACIHFSDVVLLNRREGVEQTWIRDFMERYKKGKCYPCLFEHVKKGRVTNPAEVLDTVPRRISMIFEPEGDPLDDLDFDEDDLPDEPFDLTGKADPYLERLPSGQRAKVLPNIAKFLSA